MHFPVLMRSARLAFRRIIPPHHQAQSYGVVSCLRGFHTHDATRTVTLKSTNCYVSEATSERLLQPRERLQVGHPYHGFSFEGGPQKKPAEAKSFLDRLQDAPSPALYLGFAGLLPFVGPALFCLGSLSYSPFLAFTQVTYGATVLSFLGGIHWGYSIDNAASPPSWRNLGYSVVPPLIAWGGLLLTAEFGTLLLMAGFAIAWRRDVKFTNMPAWFRALRVCLSVGAVLSLGLTYTMGLLYPPPDTSTTYNWVKLMKIIKIILED